MSDHQHHQQQQQRRHGRRKRKNNNNNAAESEQHSPDNIKEALLRSGSSPLPSYPDVRIAMYVAMAHAGLAFSLALLYGVTKLRQGYWRPIHWAILCSMPLRELHTALVSFCSHSLHLGLFQTLIALPIAALRATTASLLDSRTAVQPLLRRRRKLSFSKLTQWLISLGLFVVAYESIGLFSLPAFGFACLLPYCVIDPGVATTLSVIASVRHGSRFKFRNDMNLGRRMSRYVTCLMLSRLKTTVAIGLIMVMIVGSSFGFVFFSYKIAMEGKEAVISLKAHLEENNYAERVGLRKWMDENHVPELIDNYATKCYETVSQNIDSLAAHYNVTEIVDSVKHYLSTNFKSQTSYINPKNNNISSRTTSSRTSVSNVNVVQANLSDKFFSIRSRVKNRGWRVIYRDIDGVFREFMSLIAREELAEKTKAFLLQGLDLSRRVLASGTMVLAGGANLLLFMAVSLVSGAAGFFNFNFCSFPIHVGRSNYGSFADDSDDCLQKSVRRIRPCFWRGNQCLVIL